jgi:hypothetical protein
MKEQFVLFSTIFSILAAVEIDLRKIMYFLGALFFSSVLKEIRFEINEEKRF